MRKGLLYLFMLTAVSAVTWANVISDPGFESVSLGTVSDNWDVPQWASFNGGFEAQDYIVRSGSVAVKTGLNPTAYSNLRRSFQPVGWSPEDFENKWWSYSAWIYYDSTEAGNGASTDAIIIQGYVTNTWNIHRLDVSQVITPDDLVDGEWNYIEIRGQAGAANLDPADPDYDNKVTNRVSIVFGQVGPEHTGTFYIDDVSASISTSWLGNVPEEGELVPYSDPVALSWILPDPNDPAQDQRVNVSFWNEPNALLWQEGVNYWTLLTDFPNATSANATPIEYDTQYWWYLGIDNSTGPLADANDVIAELYTFTTAPQNLAPVVDAGLDQTVFLVGGTVQLQMAASVIDEDFTLNEWAVTGKDPVGISDPLFDDPFALDAIVTFTEAGVYKFTLTADDGEKQGSDTLTITVAYEYPSVLADSGFESTEAGVIPDGGNLYQWQSFNGNFDVGSVQVRTGLQSCMIGYKDLVNASGDKYSNLRHGYFSDFPEKEIAGKRWVASAWVYYDATAPGNTPATDAFEFGLVSTDNWNTATVASEIVVKGTELISGQWNFVQVFLNVPVQALDPEDSFYNDKIRNKVYVRIEQNGWVGQTGDFYIDDVSLASIDPWHNFDPTPADGASVYPLNPFTLSWTNPEPENPAESIVVDVWFADVNDTLWIPADKIVHRQPVSDITVTVDPFTTYHWQIIAYDTGTDANTPSDVYIFSTLDGNLPPVVDAGPDVLTYLVDGAVDVTLAASVTDEASTDNNWTFTKNPPEIADPSIVPSDALNAVVTFTEAGIYTLTLTADDGQKQASDDMIVYVGTDPCDAARRHPDGYIPYVGDINNDCEVSFQDVVDMMINWLEDNSLTGTVVLP